MLVTGGVGLGIGQEYYLIYPIVEWRGNEVTSSGGEHFAKSCNRHYIRLIDSKRRKSPSNHWWLFGILGWVFSSLSNTSLGFQD